MALTIHFDDMRPAVKREVTPSETQVPKVRPVEIPNMLISDTGIKAKPLSTFEIPEEPIIEALEEDLESKLANLFD